MSQQYINLNCDSQNDTILVLWGVNNIPPVDSFIDTETREKYVVYRKDKDVIEIIERVKLAAYKAEDLDIRATDDILRGYLASKIWPNTYYHLDAVKQAS